MLPKSGVGKGYDIEEIAFEISNWTTKWPYYAVFVSEFTEVGSSVMIAITCKHPTGAAVCSDSISSDMVGELDKALDKYYKVFKNGKNFKMTWIQYTENILVSR